MIDFIDMSDRSNRDAVLTTLQAELARDRTKTYVVEISPLGLVEMTRQNTTLGLRETLTSPCPLCHGDGRVISEETALVDVCRQLKNLASSTDTPDLRVEVHPRVAERLLSGGGPLLEQLEAETGCCVHIRAADDDRPLDYLAAIRG